MTFQPDSSTLVDLLELRCALQPNRLAYSFLADKKTDALRLTYLDLARRARSIATHIQAIARPGDRALLLYPAGLNFIAAFFGCLYAGIIPVPTPLSHRQGSDDRLLGIVKDAQPALILTEAGVGATKQQIWRGGGMAEHRHDFRVEHRAVATCPYRW